MFLFNKSSIFSHIFDIIFARSKNDRRGQKCRHDFAMAGEKIAMPSGSRTLPAFKFITSADSKRDTQL
jgi:hypothetical protein